MSVILEYARETRVSQVPAAVGCEYPTARWYLSSSIFASAGLKLALIGVSFVRLVPSRMIGPGGTSRTKFRSASIRSVPVPRLSAARYNRWPWDTFSRLSANPRLCPSSAIDCR